MKLNNLEVALSSTNPSSENAYDGKISVKVSGGNPPYYIHVISNTAFNNKTYDNKSDLDLIGLSKGDYFITVTDAKNHKFYQAIKL
jgi:hypothetical protein